MSGDVGLFRLAGNQRGMAMVSALLLLLVVSLLAVGLSMDSSMDVRGAGYQRVNARSFGFTESGLLAAADILEDNAFEAGWPVGEFPNKSLLYNGSIKILDGTFYMSKNNNEVLIMQLTGDISADITTQYLDSILAHGGAIQVAAGYMGAGKGLGGGGGQALYNIQSRGKDVTAGAQQAARNLGLVYLYVTK